jgi:hypothetical protein
VANEVEELQKQNAELKEELQRQRYIRVQEELDRAKRECQELRAKVQELTKAPTVDSEKVLDLISDGLSKFRDEMKAIGKDATAVMSEGKLLEIKEILDIKSQTDTTITVDPDGTVHLPAAFKYSGFCKALWESAEKEKVHLTELAKEVFGEEKKNSPKEALPAIAQSFMDTLVKYGYTQGQAKTITDHILMVAGESGLENYTKITEVLEAFSYYGNPELRKNVLIYWSAKMKLMR